MLFPPLHPLQPFNALGAFVQATMRTTAMQGNIHSNVIELGHQLSKKKGQIQSLVMNLRRNFLGTQVSTRHLQHRLTGTPIQVRLVT